MAFYVLDDNNNRVPALDQEGVYAVLEQAIADGSLANLVADAAFVSKLRCCVTGGTNKVAFVTQAKYNELKASNQLVTNCLYYITDDTSAEDIDEQFNALNTAINSLGSRATALESRASNLESRTSELERKSVTLTYLGAPNFTYNDAKGILVTKNGFLIVNTLKSDTYYYTRIIDIELHAEYASTGEHTCYASELKMVNVVGAGWLVYPADSTVKIIDATLLG